MHAFDEMLELEEKSKRLGLEIGKTRDLVRQCSRRVLDLKTTLATLDIGMVELERSIARMKGPETPVVLLSEYERLVVLLTQNMDLRHAKQEELKRTEKQGREAESSLPVMEALLQSVEKQISSYGQVIPFPAQ